MSLKSVFIFLGYFLVSSAIFAGEKNTCDQTGCDGRCDPEYSEFKNAAREVSPGDDQSACGQKIKPNRFLNAVCR